MDLSDVAKDTTAVVLAGLTLTTLVYEADYVAIAHFLHVNGKIPV